MSDRSDEQVLASLEVPVIEGAVAPALHQATFDPAPPACRRLRLRATYELAGGRPDALRHAAGRCWPEEERHPRHCP